MNREEHEKEVKSLEQLEHQLIELISTIGNDELRSKFLKWQKQRAKCNEGFLDSLKTELNQQPQIQSAEVCPVCKGNGLVPNGFYNQTSGNWSGTSIVPEKCRSCEGSGVYPNQKALTVSDGWISVEDRLPENWKIVIVYYHIADERYSMTSGHYDGVSWKIDRIDENKITHWQPLPTPPINKEQ